MAFFAGSNTGSSWFQSPFEGAQTESLRAQDAYRFHTGGGSYRENPYDMARGQSYQNLSRDEAQQLRLANAGIDWKKQAFGQIFPLLRDQLGQMQGNFQTAGGASGQGPPITVGPVWDDRLMQQNINAAQAGVDQATQQRIREARQGVTGSGFGANSPLAQALTQGYQNQGLAQRSSAERDIRTSMATENARQRLGSETARETQFANRQQEDIERRKPYFSTYNALLGVSPDLFEVKNA